MSSRQWPYAETSPRRRVPLQQRAARAALEVSPLAARGEDFGQLLMLRVMELLDADVGAGLTTWRPSSQDLTAEVRGIPALTDQHATHALGFLETHPGLRAMAQAGTRRAIRLSDHTNLRQYWSTESYHAMHGHCDGRYSASALLLANDDKLIFLVVHRHDRDFTDDQMAAFDALQRPVAASLAFRAALDDTVRLLQRDDATEPRPEGESATPWLRHDPDSDSDSDQNYRPTRREAEVLALTAEGWTNFQIGRRLGITERTVRKHLSAVYDHAGIRGRAAAAAWWQRQTS